MMLNIARLILPLLIVGLASAACGEDSLPDIWEEQNARAELATSHEESAPESPLAPPTLQMLIDLAEPGDVVPVPPGVYRENVMINKPVTLDGQSRAEIRGSDVWTAWSPSGSRWLSGSSVPVFAERNPGRCRPGSNGRCAWPEQVFLDGTPLLQVASNPTSGQFALDGSRRVVLADDPTGKLVEVSVRRRWIQTNADGVVITGFIMKHAANSSQSAPVGNQDRSSWTLQDSVLSDTHGDVVSIGGGTNNKVLRNDISRGGNQGIGSGSSDRATLQGNRIHHNNTEEFNLDWQGGALKMAAHSNLVIDDNEVYANGGPGIWCDIGCKNVQISNNRVFDNQAAGIFFEISRGAKIFGNTVWRNGLTTSWAYGAGILVSSSSDTEVYNNVVAWNGEAIAVISDPRSDRTYNEVGAINIRVHNNTMAVWEQTRPAATWRARRDDVLFSAASNNGGSNNAYWYPGAENTAARYAWNGDISALAAFNATLGEEAARYLTTIEKDQALKAAGVPVAP